jgi:hypothetical protein
VIRTRSERAGNDNGGFDIPARKFPGVADSENMPDCSTQMVEETDRLQHFGQKLSLK